MPTTCGFPNCRFRSRYRGAEDNRHFYRVPKKPAILRKKWLEAIGRTEETIVSQLRVCSGHFYGGEKHEGDVPVADPAIDEPIRVELPPKIPRIQSSTLNKRNCYGIRGGGGVGSGSTTGRGRGSSHHTQGIRNKMCFLKSGMLNYMTKHNNCLSIMGSMVKQKHTLTPHSTALSSTLRNDCKLRNEEPINMNNIKNCTNNYPLTWLNNLYPPHIYDYLKSLPLSTSVSSSVTELSTNHGSNTTKKPFYDVEKQYLQNSMNEDQSVLKNYTQEFINSESQQANYTLNKSLSQQINNHSRCSTPPPTTTTTTVCLTNLIQNENDVIQKSYSSPYKNKRHQYQQHHQVQPSAFSPVSNHHFTCNNNDNLASNSIQIKSPSVLHKEHQQQQWLNAPSLENLQKLNSSISLPFPSNLSTDYFLTLASAAMNGVLTQKFTENYINSCKFQQFDNQKYVEEQVNLKDAPQTIVNNTNSLFKQNHDNIELEHLTTFPYNILNPTSSINNTIFMNERNEIKDLSMKSTYQTEISNISRLNDKNERYSSYNYEKNNDNNVGDRKDIRGNVNHSRKNVFTKCDPDEKLSYRQCLELKEQEERFNQPTDGICLLKPTVKYVLFIGINELTVELSILNDVTNLLCVDYSELINLPEHVCQSVSDIVIYQESAQSVKIYQHFPCLKNVYIPECLAYTTCWNELITITDVNLHIVPPELDVNKTVDFIIGILLSTNYDIPNLYSSNKDSQIIKRPASSPAQTMMNDLMETNRRIQYRNNNDISFQPTIDDQKSDVMSSKNSTVNIMDKSSSIQIGIIGLGSISLALIRRLEKFNYTIRLFDMHLPDGMDTVLNLQCVNSLEEIVLQSDWIIMIHERSIINEQCSDYSSLVINEMFDDNTMCKMKAGSHIVYINLVEDLPTGFILLNSAVLSGKVQSAHGLFRKSCHKISDELNVQLSSNFYCLNKRLNMLQINFTELRLYMSQSIKRNLLKASSSLQYKMNEIIQTEGESRIKIEQSQTSNLYDWKSNSTMKASLKQFSDSNQEMASHEVNKQLIFGINSLVAPKVSKQYGIRRE